MLKKILCTTALCASLLAVGATGAQARPAVNQQDGTLYSPLTGLYVGAYGGWDWTHGQINNAPNAHLAGPDYGGFVGYSLDTLIDHYAGIGLTGSIEGHWGYSNSRDHYAGVATLRKRDEWGVDFRPGLTVINDMSPFGLKPYGIIGYTRARFAGSAAGIGGSEHDNGLALGLGTELLTFQHFGVRADYEHVFYQKNNGIDPSSNELRVGLALHF